MFELEENVPIPEEPRGAAGQSKPAAKRKYPFREMQVNQSFFVPGKRPYDLGGVTQSARRSTGFTFKTRAVEENGVKGTRIWRVA